MNKIILLLAIVGLSVTLNAQSKYMPCAPYDYSRDLNGMIQIMKTKPGIFAAYRQFIAYNISTEKMATKGDRDNVKKILDSAVKDPEVLRKYLVLMDSNAWDIKKNLNHANRNDTIIPFDHEGRKSKYYTAFAYTGYDGITFQKIFAKNSCGNPQKSKDKEVPAYVIGAFVPENNKGKYKSDSTELKNQKKGGSPKKKNLNLKDSSVTDSPVPATDSTDVIDLNNEQDELPVNFTDSLQDASERYGATLVNRDLKPSRVKKNPGMEEISKNLNQRYAKNGNWWYRSGERSVIRVKVQNSFLSKSKTLTVIGNDGGVVKIKLPKKGDKIHSSGAKVIDDMTVEGLLWYLYKTK